MKKEETKKAVREGYARVALQGSTCCGPVSSCCGTTDTAQEISRKIGYSDAELKAVPEAANLGLGCGNPVAIASLKEGETVIDLGSGPGLDCFLAAKQVGRDGRVIGIDMTPEMIDKARENARRSDYSNVEFRLGEIEHLPVADNSVDVVISNCVINLSTDKHGVFQEVYRVLKRGGRMMVSDIVLTGPLPGSVRDSANAYVSCISGAVTKDEYLEAAKAAGFKHAELFDEISFSIEESIHDPATMNLKSNISKAEAAQYLASVKIRAVK